MLYIQLYLFIYNENLLESPLRRKWSILNDHPVSRRPWSLLFWPWKKTIISVPMPIYFFMCLCGINRRPPLYININSYSSYRHLTYVCINIEWGAYNRLLSLWRGSSVPVSIHQKVLSECLGGMLNLSRYQWELSRE